MTTHPFEVGRRYANKFGQYEVLAIRGDRLSVQFDDGQTQDLDLATQARIWRRLLEEQAMAASLAAGSASKGKASASKSAKKPAQGTQYWLKPQGDPDDPSSLQQAFSGERYLIGFARRPSGVRVGDVLLVYRIGIAAIQYAAEALDECRSATAAEIAREPWRERWSWVIEARNLTPEFGAAWSQRSLHIRALANEYDKHHPDAPLSLGTLNYGADKVRVPKDFAVGVLERMRGGR